MPEIPPVHLAAMHENPKMPAEEDGQISITVSGIHGEIKGSAGKGQRVCATFPADASWCWLLDMCRLM